MEELIIDIEIENEETIELVSEEETVLDIQEEKIIVEVKDSDKYKGEYEFTPLAHQKQIVETKNKVLAEDITIFEVPYFEVSNKEGTTVYIARGDE